MRKRIFPQTILACLSGAQLGWIPRGKMQKNSWHYHFNALQITSKWDPVLQNPSLRTQKQNTANVLFKNKQNLYSISYINRIIDDRMENSVNGTQVRYNLR